MAVTDEFKELESEGSYRRIDSTLTDFENYKRALNSVYDDDKTKAEMAKPDFNQRLFCKYLAEEVQKKLRLQLKAKLEGTKPANWACSLTVLVGTCYGISNFFNPAKSMFNIMAFSNSKYTVTIIIESGVADQ